VTRGGTLGACALAVLFLTAVGVLPASAAQQSVSVNVVPGPTSGPPVDCLQSLDAAGRRTATFVERSPIRVRLEDGCARPNESDIPIDVQSTPVLLTVANADAGGGFTTPPRRLPRSVLPGSHEIVVRTLDRTYRARITVTPLTEVLGVAISRRGPLPHTGQDIVRLLLLALGLAAAGSMLIGGVWLARRRRTSSLEAER
jgi:LPXTG-motif cell wall-anchored protein